MTRAKPSAAHKRRLIGAGVLDEAIQRAQGHSLFAFGLLVAHGVGWLLSMILIAHVAALVSWGAFYEMTMVRWLADFERTYAIVADQPNDALVLTHPDYPPAPSLKSEAFIADKSIGDDALVLAAGEQSIRVLNLMRGPFIFVVTAALMICMTVGQRLVMFKRRPGK